MILDRVTVTGADDSVGPEALWTLQRRFPFVEWGILLSKSQEGSPRFPTTKWIQAFLGGPRSPGGISGHLCGRWVRALLLGGDDFAQMRPTIAGRFDRIQLNFHASLHDVQPGEAAPALQALQPWGGYVVQVDGVNDDKLRRFQDWGLRVAPLYDRSGGAGILPDFWPLPGAGYVGYAGGLSPENVGEQLGRLAAHVPATQRLWIDAETRLRSDDDQQFDLDKVHRFLAAAEPWIGGGRG